MRPKHGIWFSRPGNGICHQVHLERFSVPGQTLLGSDSHTPTCGAAGMLAIGAGGLDVAVAMGGGAYYLTMPKVCHVVLTGELNPMVSAKDVILEVLRRLTVKGGVGKIMEYGGPGVETLSVPDARDHRQHGRRARRDHHRVPQRPSAPVHSSPPEAAAADWAPLTADEDAEYDEEITIDLSALHPLAAHAALARTTSCPVSEIAGHQGRPGLHRQLHQLQLLRPHARGRHTRGPARGRRTSA